MQLHLFERALWAAQGVLLWLARRPQLRWAPLPWPSVETLPQWRLQAEAMVSHRSLPRRHLERGREHFNAKALAELTWLRNRIGLKMAFLEDPLLEGMLAARANRGARNKIKTMIFQEEQAKAREIEAAGDRHQAARQLIGPRGRLPSLKADLVRLATLLHVNLDGKETIEILKGKIRGPLSAIIASGKVKPGQPNQPDEEPVPSR